VLPILFDEGLPPAVAEALSMLGLVARAVGHPGAPARQTADQTNCEWCRSNDAVLITTDRGRRDRTIFDHLSQLGVHAIFVHNDLRLAAPHVLARAVLVAESKMDHIAQNHVLRHRLRLGGGLDKR
jgi:uncharacterized protein with PIN domain